jgi:excisionase family DNA binding protein
MSAQLAVGSGMPTQKLASPKWGRSEGRAKGKATVVSPPGPEADRPQPISLADRIERMESAMNAEQLAQILNVSKITIFKHAKAGRIPSFRIGTCVRFDPRAVAKWLRTQ